MLYKKYHRDFVKQFKVGTKIKLHLENNCTTTIERAPYIDKYSQICIIDNLQERCLFSHNGKKIQENIEIVG